MFMSVFMVVLLVMGVFWCSIWAVMTVKELYFTGSKWDQKI